MASPVSTGGASDGRKPGGAGLPPGLAQAAQVAVAAEATAPGGGTSSVAPGTPPGAAAGAPRRFGVLRHSNFTFLWIGLLVSNSGTWMQSAAQGYLIYNKLNPSPLALGLLGVSSAVPMLVISPFGGVIADRVDRLALLRITNVLWIVMTAALAVLTWMGQVTYWEILLTSFLSAAILAFDNPARQSLIPDLVPRSELLAAISLNSVAFTGASLVGPAVAGLILAVFGADLYHGSAIVFVCNAISYAAVLVPVVFWIRVPHHPHTGPRATIGADLVEGLRFVRERRPLVLLLSMTAVTSVFGRSFTQLMPVFAKDVLRVGPDGLGMMYSAPGAGTLVCGVCLATLGHLVSRRHLLTGAVVSFAVVIFAFALSHSYPLSLGILFLSGLTGTAVTATIATLLQMQAPGRMRGRVMSLQSQAVIGMTPLGSLLSGWLATRVPAPLAVSVTAAVVLLYLGYVLGAQPAWRNIEPDE